MFVLVGIAVSRFVSEVLHCNTGKYRYLLVMSVIAAKVGRNEECIWFYLLRVIRLKLTEF